MRSSTNKKLRRAILTLCGGVAGVFLGTVGEDIYSSRTATTVQDAAIAWLSSRAGANVPERRLEDKSLLFKTLSASILASKGGDNSRLLELCRELGLRECLREQFLPSAEDFGR